MTTSKDITRCRDNWQKEIDGAAITLMTGRNVFYSGLRQVVIGLIAAVITFGVGKLIGVSVAG